MLTILSSPLPTVAQSEFHGLQPPVINWQSYNHILNQQAVPCRQAAGNNSIIHRRLLITDTITVSPAQLSRLISRSDINCTIFLINLCPSQIQPQAWIKQIRQNIFFFLEMKFVQLNTVGNILWFKRNFSVKERYFVQVSPAQWLECNTTTTSSSLSESASSAGGDAGDDITAFISTAGLAWVWHQGF